MMTCETCKHFKRFNYGDACEKKRKMLLQKEKEEMQPCHEMDLGFDQIENIFNPFFGKGSK